jgi:hypothetical protein
MPTRPSPRTVQHELDLIHGYHPEACTCGAPPGWLVVAREPRADWARVAARWGARITERSPEKREAVAPARATASSIATDCGSARGCKTDVA